VTVLDHLIQQAINGENQQYDAAWSNSDYMGTPNAVDLSALALGAVTPLYVDTGDKCNKDAVKDILDSLTYFSFNWTDSRANAVGDNDAVWVSTNTALLGEADALM